MARPRKKVVKICYRTRITGNIFSKLIHCFNVLVGRPIKLNSTISPEDLISLE